VASGVAPDDLRVGAVDDADSPQVQPLRDLDVVEVGLAQRGEDPAHPGVPVVERGTLRQE